MVSSEISPDWSVKQEHCYWQSDRTGKERNCGKSWSDERKVIDLVGGIGDAEEAIEMENQFPRDPIVEFIGATRVYPWHR
jgi:hypothetical protein